MPHIVYRMSRFVLRSADSYIYRYHHLPIPPSGIVYAPNTQPQSWSASLDFNLVGATLPPVDTTACVARLPDLSTGLLLFDTLMTNCDRHRGNFAVDFLAQPPKMSVFDHSHALFGFQAGWGQQRLRDLRDHLGVTGGPHTHRATATAYSTTSTRTVTLISD